MPPALLLAGLVAGSGTAAATTTCASPIVAGDTVLCGSLADGATYLIEVPAHWNRSLFLYSHGYVVPGSTNDAQDVGDPATGGWLLSHGYALAGSSYASTGWAIQQALPDQIATLNLFGKRVGHPRRTIAWGHSLGGIITAGLIQRCPKRFSAALPMCGVLAGGVATWNTALDGAFAFQQLIDPSVQVTGITSPQANLQGAESAAAAAQATAQGQARLALSAALGDTPAGSRRCRPSRPRPTTRARRPTSISGTPTWTSRSSSSSVPNWRRGRAATRPGTPGWTTSASWPGRLTSLRSGRCTRPPGSACGPTCAR